MESVENRANFYSWTLTYVCWGAQMASLLLTSLYFLWCKEQDISFLLRKINFPDWIANYLKA